MPRVWKLPFSALLFGSIFTQLSGSRHIWSGFSLKPCFTTHIFPKLCTFFFLSYDIALSHTHLSKKNYKLDKFDSFICVGITFVLVLLSIYYVKLLDIVNITFINGNYKYYITYNFFFFL